MIRVCARYAYVSATVCVCGSMKYLACVHVRMRLRHGQTGARARASPSRRGPHLAAAHPPEEVDEEAGRCQAPRDPCSAQTRPRHSSNGFRVVGAG